MLLILLIDTKGVMNGNHSYDPPGLVESIIDNIELSIDSPHMRSIKISFLDKLIKCIVLGSSKLLLSIVNKGGDQKPINISKYVNYLAQ